ncbi:hypothetical protein FRX31_018771 [Thalictrum thalictroides]|uniref:RRM domain-containing protein n=1 Tax=Thalictrum thalictroides TaxID=46969 RepID=A0A7J6W3I0_THATH|nr:hypothetical protein FRX31_018771 [Thalictrum thalictroides]
MFIVIEFYVEQTNGVVPVEKSNGVVPVEEVKSVKGNGVVPMEEVKSVDTETSAKKEKEAVEHHHFLIDDDLSMLSDDPEICTSGDVEPFPFPGCGPIPGFIPISKVKENAIDNSLLIDHLSEGTGAEDLLKLFSIYGHVTQILIPTDKTTGRLESFGLVFFRNIDDAERALNSLNEEGYHVEWYVDEQHLTVICMSMKAICTSM